MGIAVESGQPTNNSAVISDGALVADGWSCIFDGASTGNKALALCCNY